VGRFLAGLILGILLFPLTVMVYLMLGLAPAAASAPPMPFERYIAGTALQKRIRREAPRRDVASFATQDLIAGADVYKKNCAMCHGAFQQAAPAIAKAMFPEAPQLLTPRGMVTDDPVGVTYWKVQNGIRLSGMPGFASILKDQDKWNVSALLARVNTLPAEAQEALKTTPQAGLPSAPTPSTFSKKK
jgi:thiosulfate dehydrogenase